MAFTKRTDGNQTSYGELLLMSSYEKLHSSGRMNSQGQLRPKSANSQTTQTLL